MSAGDGLLPSVDHAFELGGDLSGAIGRIAKVCRATAQQQPTG